MSDEAGAPSLVRSWRRVGCGGCLAALFALFAGIWWLVPRPPRPASPPKNNGYEALALIANDAAKIDMGDPANQPLPALSDLVERHRAIFDAAKAALDQDSLVPVEYNQAWLVEDLERIGRFRSLGRLFLAKARVDSVKPELSDAIGDYLDVIRLSLRISQGGLLSDAMTGAAIRRQALQGLGGLQPRLLPDQARRLIRDLISLDNRVEPFSNVGRRDMEFGANANGFAGRLASLFPQIRNMALAGIKAGENSIHASTLLQRRLILQIAIQFYRADQGSDPDRLADLVPNYLSEIPLDPFGTKPLGYEKTDAGGRIVSVGPQEKTKAAPPQGGAASKTQ